MNIKQATTAVMNAITAAVIAILNVSIRFRPLVRRSSVGKRRSRSKSRRRIFNAGPARANFCTLSKRRCEPLSLTSPPDRAAVAPAELSASELGQPRDEGHVAAAAGQAGFEVNVGAA